MAIIDRIKFDGTSDDQSWLVYKYPSDEFVLGSQLIVNQSQEALFFKGGEALDLFGPGTHTLSTGNIPILKKLVNIPFGGNTPFSAEIYYINNTSRLDMKWGTSVPFQIMDPMLNNIIGVRAFGQFGISINDSRTFITKIIGAVKEGHISDYDVVRKYFNGLINTKIKELVATYITRKKISVLDITTYLSEISENSKNSINEEFESYGIEIKNFYIESVNFPKEDISKVKEAYERRSELKVLGEDYYRQRSFDVLEKLADNEAAGGAANAGLGLGMGLGAGQAMGDVFSGIARNINVDRTPQSLQQNPSVTGIHCQNCNSMNTEGSKFCGQCGQPQGRKKCRQCGHTLKPTNTVCDECGTKC